MTEAEYGPRPVAVANRSGAKASRIPRNAPLLKDGFSHPIVMILRTAARLLALACLIVPAAGAQAQKAAAAATRPAAKPGPFTAAQATRGQQVFRMTCARCHTTAQYTGAPFEAAWGKRRAYDLYDVLTNTMPQDDPGSLSDQQYIDVIAYILRLNGLTPGPAPLKSDAASLKAIRIEIPRK